MKKSLIRRMSIALSAALIAGAATSSYILAKFKAYESATVKVLSGDQKTILSGQLLEARVKAASELVEGSVANPEADEAFRQKIAVLKEDLRQLNAELAGSGLANRESFSRGLEDAVKDLAAIGSDTANPISDDLFVQYRNIKTQAFNLYRLAWNNKWMSVARGIGLMINDLDNIPYNEGKKAAAGIQYKIAQLVSVVTGSSLAQDGKLAIFGQLTAIKQQAIQYQKSFEAAEKHRERRAEVLATTGATLKKINETQGKGLIQFGNAGNSSLLAAILAFVSFVAFAVAWYFGCTKRLARHLKLLGDHFVKQFSGWISPSGIVGHQGFKMPDNPDTELQHVYTLLDDTMRRVGTLRKEEMLIKRLLNVPFLLVNNTKQAVFWNSALGNLAKARSLEETGPTSYLSLIRFTDAQGRVVDPVEKAMTEGKEITQLALLRAGNDGIATYVLCTPVFAPDKQVEYVMVHVRDLREENKRAEAELDRQLEIVRKAVDLIRHGELPDSPAAGTGTLFRRSVADTINALRAFALDLREKTATVSGTAGTMGTRMAREGDLKKAVHGRMEALRDEISTLKDELSGLRKVSDGISGHMNDLENHNAMIKAEYGEIKKRGAILLSDIKKSEELIGSSIDALAQACAGLDRVKENDELIRAVIEKSHVLNVNNSILGGKGARSALKPADVVSITENVTQLLMQFEHAWQLVEDSTEKIESSMAGVSGKLEEDLGTCLRMTEVERGIIKAIEHSEQIIESGATHAEGIAEQANLMGMAAGRIATKLREIERKADHLERIGRASVELQEQLERGFEGIAGQVSSLSQIPRLPS